MGTFISFGNLDKPFLRMVEAIIKNIDLLPKPIVIQAGHNLNDFKSINKEVELFAFCDSQKYLNYIKDANVIIVHAGVGAISSAIKLGKFPAVFCRKAVFLEHVDDHQVELIDYLVNKKIFSSVESDVELREYLKAGIFLGNNQEKEDIFLNRQLVLHVQKSIFELMNS